jgi:hypothetical protein
MDIDALITPTQFVTDQAGNKTAVLVDLATWEKIVTALTVLVDPDKLEVLENAALNRAMDEAQDSPVLPRAEALAFLAAED